MVGICNGIISFSGEYYCQCLYVEKDGRATLIPIYAFVNQAEALQIYNMIVDISGGIINHPEANVHCVMDIPATFRNDPNKILLSSCIKNHERTATQIMVTCTVIGIGTCWWTAGVGCLAGITCVTSLAINEIFWFRGLNTQVIGNYQCLCLESQWRINNPGLSLPTPSCGSFVCPPFAPISIGSLK